MEKDILQILACPECKRKLKLVENEKLICENCRLIFKIENEIPILLTEKANKF